MFYFGMCPITNGQLETCKDVWPDRPQMTSWNQVSHPWHV